MIHTHAIRIGHKSKSSIVTALILSALALIGLSPAMGHAQSADNSRSVTRAETVRMLILARTPDIPAIKNESQFADIPKGSWYEAFMLYAEKLRLIEPDAARKLYPERIVTRAELLHMLSYLFDVPVNMAHSYTDIEKDAWYAPYAGIARQYVLFEGSKSNRLYPYLPLTKEEVEDALSRIQYEKLREEIGRGTLQHTATHTSADDPRIYTVVSTRKLTVKLVYPQVLQEEQVPMVRRILIPPSLPALRTDIIRRVNEVRADNSLPPVTYSDKLEQSAQKYADDMAARGYFSHVSPEGQTLRDRLTETGYNRRRYDEGCNCVIGFSMGENLARGQKTAEEVMADWLASEKHRAAILNPSYTDIGVGVKGGIWVQHFGGILVP